ncbi:hypothetical protein ACU4GD_03545 [Cupriavidus basilensis]
MSGEVSGDTAHDADIAPGAGWRPPAAKGEERTLLLGKQSQQGETARGTEKAPRSPHGRREGAPRDASVPAGPWEWCD